MAKEENYSLEYPLGDMVEPYDIRRDEEIIKNEEKKYGRKNTGQKDHSDKKV